MNHQTNKSKEEEEMQINSELVFLETVRPESELELIAQIENKNKFDSLGIIGVTFLVGMSFIQMIFGALLLLDLFPETSWIMNSVISMF